MKLFTVGPVEMYEETLRIAGQQTPYFRTSDFSEVMLSTERKFLALADTPEGSRFIVLTASGTAAMEASVDNLLSPTDKALIINGGGFGKRFCEICHIHHIPFDSIDLDFGEVLTEEHLAPYENEGYTSLLVNINETSTGQLYDASLLSAFCARNDLLFIVDAISSFLADELSIASLGIDVHITSSQKALALDPGLSFVILSPRAQQRCATNSKAKSLYFDFPSYMKDMERGQTPFTPAVGIILQLKQRIDSVYTEGVEAEVAKHAQRATLFRQLCDEAGIDRVSFPQSNALTTLVFEGDAKNVFEVMRREYDKTLTPSGGNLESRVLRVGHLGDLHDEDFYELIEDLRKVLDR